jgi:hypothetical protein
MKRLLALAFAAAFAAVAATSMAQTPAAQAPAANPQQERMKDCNAKAEGKKGDERKTFMSACLSGKEVAPAKKMTQQEKMTACNKKAADMKGDERKTFMSTCLKA